MEIPNCLKMNHETIVLLEKVALRKIHVVLDACLENINNKKNSGLNFKFKKTEKGKQNKHMEKSS